MQPCHVVTRIGRTPALGNDLVERQWSSNALGTNDPA
jgi:hypothetical protein